MSSRTVSIELPEPVFAQVNALARDTARTPARVLSEALERLLALEAWQVEDIQTGLTEADAGEFATEAEVAEVFQRHGA
jgi:RHH-type transcriptional regulator, rel operon repressor / antitoxin RelB